ncbi:hypothetical protein ACQX25_03895 [Corynebacterium diphtheriae]|uniref:hypothetical protein n=1 Tax=Corynebacterium diphtheriae TaxID=1717 RepID=UPI0009B656C3|nr:hypothetical protein [Corynebacterium diphtheriae]MBG9357127.1 hypothetical protein [Corynebacterium diphtheriae bv. mitis]MBN4650181.1 hypothetical protein [Corynebacterium diphtheriae bv. mitis]MBN4652584.1 hypothetical protein [Corynebacterium diphtheriae bv. mitis]OSQ25064.1 hypothetical protein B9J72_09670 [Corynebacterium diphtheriae]UEB75170.1 hypothetical protein LK463_07970 [Corynebacterium diphtheriae]
MGSKHAKKKSAVKVTHNPLGLKIKSTCCRSNPRCINCPVVYQRLEKSGAWARDDMNLPRELKLARRW